MFETIIKLWQDGKSKKAISRAVNHDIKTVRKVINNFEKQPSETNISYKQRATLLDSFHQQIQKLTEENLSNIRIFEEIKKNGYLGSYSSLSNFTRSFKSDPKTCIRFHTDPGQEAQVDFGDVGRLPNKSGQIKRAYIFNMRLSFSRLDYYEIVFDQKVETFIQCHINSFNYFKGVPKLIKIDNLKAAIIQASFYEPIFQNIYANLATHFGFTILPCRVRKPQEKGKVENGIKYIQNNFFAGRKFIDNSNMNQQLLDWLNNYANCRIHGTTKEKPIDLFIAKEALSLKPLSKDEFALATVTTRKVHSDCHVTVDNNYYSVPCKYVGKIVEVELSNSLVRIRENNVQIALHTRIIGKGQFSTVSAHYNEYKNFNHESEFYLRKSEQEMQQIGEHTKLLFAIIVAETPNSWYRTISGILSLRKTYTDQIIELACKRALYFGISKYSKIKSICESGCYNLELPNIH